jgi:CheY-like chemotaxis protein
MSASLLRVAFAGAGQMARHHLNVVARQHDVIVPGDIGGKEAVSQLTDIDPAVKAILVSRYAQDSVLAEFRDYGFQAVITKPFTIQELSTTLDSVIGSSGWRVH